MKNRFKSFIFGATVAMMLSNISFADCDCEKVKGIDISDITTYFSALDLRKHDNEFYGHTIEKHVGKSKDWLDGRLSGNRHQKFASSYADADTANRVVKEVVLENQDKIRSWLEGDDKDRLVLTKKFDAVIGTILKKKDHELKDCKVSVVVLKRPHMNTHKFYVITSYPILNVSDLEEYNRQWKNKNKYSGN